MPAGREELSHGWGGPALRLGLLFPDLAHAAIQPMAMGEEAVTADEAATLKPGDRLRMTHECRLVNKRKSATGVFITKHRFWGDYIWVHRDGLRRPDEWMCSSWEREP